ncbi:hypothetical protein [Streptomyces sp. H27-D2]|uniref:hypothetical protein n=1 Tax=Streptomyces sp. H27-D2 TaxID=3046304 RepID=UPI002DBEA480|nr:hypothetical protein [Streptomyces sp. H27-D2]MEC4017816.1 hypothetical protein [Streptomyces sp. H27-D2]
MTVHGEREIIPSVTKPEARRVLTEFTKANNAASRAHDPNLIAATETGPYGAIDQGRLKSAHALSPGGNPNYAPLELTDARFAIPRQAGWPKFFVADTDSNRDVDKYRWLLVFRKDSADAPWKAAYLSLLSNEEMPDFATDSEGYAEPVPLGRKSDLAIAPNALSRAYASYLQDGEGGLFADGQQTSQERLRRAKLANRPGSSNQYIDLPARGDTFAPVALRTADGGALAFFSATHHQRHTAARGLKLRVKPEVEAMMTGTAKQSVTFIRVSDAAVTIPPRSGGAGGAGQVVFLNRLEGITAARGS